MEIGQDAYKNDFQTFMFLGSILIINERNVRAETLVAALSKRCSYVSKIIPYLLIQE